MEFFKNTKIINFLGISKVFASISIILVISSLGLIFLKGFNLGIDFAGGTLVELRYLKKEAPIAQIRDILESNPLFKGSSISQYDKPQDIAIRIPIFEQSNIADKIRSDLKDTGGFEILKADSVGARVGGELKEKGITSLALAIVAMMIYVSFRYEWRFALSSILALIHDITIASASIIIFKIDLNLDVIAALLTLLGYSINDTIIIFDRMRDRISNSNVLDLREAINNALSSTLSRTLLTSITVFFVVAVLYFFGGKNISGFSLPMLVGVVVGTYSSLFIAPICIMLLGFNIKKYRKTLLEKAKRKQERERIRKQYEGGVV